MRVLTTSKAIREAISKVFEDGEDERVVLVGFVGRSPLEWISNPKGATVYCWPHPRGTNPAGIDELLEAGSQVRFVDRLHAKVYWSRKGGVVIGSANLSMNALGDGGLKETAVYLAPGTIDIETLKRDLCIPNGPFDREEFGAQLEELRRKYVLERQRNPQDEEDVSDTTTKRIPSFEEWLDMPFRRQWQLGLWYGANAAPEDAVQTFKSDFNVDHYVTFRSGGTPDDLTCQVPTLEAKWAKNEWQLNGSNAIRWWYPESRYETSDPTWGEQKHIWLARTLVPEGETVPFNASTRRFRLALNNTLRQLKEEVESYKGPVPESFIALLREKYAETFSGKWNTYLRDETAQ